MEIKEVGEYNLSIKFTFNYRVKGLNDKKSVEFNIEKFELDQIKKNILVRKKHLKSKKNSLVLNFYYDVKKLNEEFEEIQRYISNKDDEIQSKKDRALWKKIIQPSFTSNNKSDLDHVIKLLKLKKNNFQFNNTLTEKQVRILLLNRIPIRSPFFYDFLLWRSIYFFPQIILVIFIILAIIQEVI